MTASGARLAPCDLVLVEGLKRGDHPKLEVWRADCGLPQLALNDTEAVLDFVLRRVAQHAGSRRSLAE